jgi:hypothetical protein
MSCRIEARRDKSPNQFGTVGAQSIEMHRAGGGRINTRINCFSTIRCIPHSVLPGSFPALRAFRSSDKRTGSKRLFKTFIKTMLKIPAAIILGMLLFSMTSARAEPIGQGDAVVQLLNLFASRADPLATANAGKLVNDGISPADVVATDLHKPLPSLKGWNSSDTTRSLAKMLGSYVASHPDRFPEGLPAAGTVTTPLRLGPFFEGLFDLYPRPFDLFRKELGKLQPLLDRSWLDAAANNGSIQEEDFFSLKC